MHACTAHWGMKLSLAVVLANARRALRHLDRLRGEARRVVAGRAVARGRRVRAVHAVAMVHGAGRAA